MSNDISIALDTSAINHYRDMLPMFPKEVNKAAAAAINRTLTHMRSKISQEVRSKYVIKAGTVKSAVYMRRASTSLTSGFIGAKGRPLDVTKFRVRVRKRGGVFVQVKKDGGKLQPHSFFLTTKVKPGVYHRISSSRLPIKHEYGPSIPTMIDNPQVFQAITTDSQAFFENRLMHEIDYRIGGIK